MKKKTIALSAAAVLAAIPAAAVSIGAISNLHPPVKPEEGKIRVACVGDSITYGFLVAGQPFNNYPAQLEKLLGEAYTVGNFGYTDRTAQKDADRPYIKESLFEKSIAYTPDIVVLMLGTNDTKPANWDAAAYERDLADLVRCYKALPSSPAVYLLTPPPLFQIGEKVWGLQADVLEEDVLPAVARVAEAEEVPCIDVHTVFEGHQEFFPDGCHLNAKGATLLAQTVASRILRDAL
jgi:lysophospholipase L1-like esterase